MIYLTQDEQKDRESERERASWYENTCFSDRKKCLVSILKAD